jgi:hypothetical protein
MNTAMRIFGTLMILVFCALASFSQSPELQKKYKLVENLSTGEFVFIKDNRFGVVNLSGKIILPAQYRNIYASNCGYYVAGDSMGIGVVSAENKTVLPFEFDKVVIVGERKFYVYKNGVSFVVSEKNRYLNDIPAETLLAEWEKSINSPPPVEMLLEETDLRIKKGQLQIQSGGEIVKINYTELQPLFSDNGLYKYRWNGKWGVVGSDGKQLSDAIYDNIADDYNSGLLIVTKDHKQGLLRRDMHAVTPIKYDAIMRFNKDLIAIVRLDNAMGLMRSDGTIVLDLVKGYIGEYNEVLFQITFANDSIAIIDKHLQSILPRGAKLAAYSGDKILFRQNQKMGAINAAGYTLIQPVYDEVYFGNTDGEENIYFMARSGKAWGMVDLQGKTIVPFEYDKINLFEEGLSVAIKNGKYGVINDANAIAVPFIYDDAEYNFNKQGLLRVKKDNKYGMIDKKGTVIIPLNYDLLDSECEEDICRAQQNGKWGFLDINGRTIIPFDYEDARAFYYTETTRVKKNGKWYEINKQGKIVKEIKE